MPDNVIDLLDGIGADYDVIACAPELSDTAVFCAAYGYPLEDTANTIIVVGKSTPPVFAACVVMGDSRLDVNGTVRHRLGVRKASFASTDDTAGLTGMTIGGVTPFGLPDGLPLWIDARVMARQRIILGGGTRDRKIHTPPETLTALPGAVVVEGLSAPVSGKGPPG